MSRGGAGEAPLFAGKIHGVRGWSLAAGRLAGAGVAVPWTPGEAMRAQCVNARHPAPDPACECGLYAVHPWAAGAAMGEVLGVVEAWGRVELHPSGFRAEHARPLALFAPAGLVPGERQRLADLAGRYRCELVELASPDELERCCAARGWGLDEATVARLVGVEPARSPLTVPVPVPVPVGGGSPAPAPAPAPPEPRDWRWWAKQAAMAPVWALAALLSLAWYGGWALLFSTMAYFAFAEVTGWDPLGLDDEPAALAPAPDVRIAWQRVLPASGEAPATYVAELRNHGRTAAWRARPPLRVRVGGEWRSIGPRRIVHPAVVPAGGRALVVAPLADGPGKRVAASARGGRVVAREPAEPGPGDLAPARVRAAIEGGRDGCRVVVRVSARRPLERLRLWILVGSRHAAAHNLVADRLRDVPSGRSRHVRERFRRCPRPWPELAAYPRWRQSDLVTAGRRR